MPIPAVLPHCFPWGIDAQEGYHCRHGLLHWGACLSAFMSIFCHNRCMSVCMLMITCHGMGDACTGVLTCVSLQGLGHFKEPCGPNACSHKSSYHARRLCLLWPPRLRCFQPNGCICVNIFGVPHQPNLNKCVPWCRTVSGTQSWKSVCLFSVPCALRLLLLLD